MRERERERERYKQTKINKPLIDKLRDPDDTIDGEFVTREFKKSNVALTKRLQTNGAGTHKVRRFDADISQDRVLSQ